MLTTHLNFVLMRKAAF